jgi:iron-sulfur cluster assembly accessory protein
MIKRAFTTLKKSPIIITDNAWSKIFKIGKIQKSERFIFSATSGGCNGFNYTFKLLEDDEYQDIRDEYRGKKIQPTIITNGSLEVFIDPLSEFLLIGTTIDYVFENYSRGIFENKFIFIADKTLASSCGCGVSFTPKN